VGKKQCGGRSNFKDIFATDENSAILDNPEVAQSRPALRAALESKKLGGRVDQHGGQVSANGLETIRIIHHKMIPFYPSCETFRRERNMGKYSEGIL
jgi:hypothetical protein